MPAVTIDAMLAGRAIAVASVNGAPLNSAIAKAPCAGARWLSRSGLQGDEQGDRVYHGGPDKALHHYAAEHYAAWRARFPDIAACFGPGAFGENLSTHGLTEDNVHVGDVFSAGGTLLQVTQARQPCFRLNLRLGRRDAACAMQASGRTGWYYRVLREGWLAAGDVLRLVERPCPDWPLARVIAALYPSDPFEPTLHEEWGRAAALPELAERWRATFAKRLASGAIEDWTMRLQGPADLAPLPLTD